jgi:lipoprotein-anchoring transpeptidase ErfK/SrfK
MAKVNAGAKPYRALRRRTLRTAACGKHRHARTFSPLDSEPYPHRNEHFIVTRLLAAAALAAVLAACSERPAGGNPSDPAPSRTPVAVPTTAPTPATVNAAAYAPPPTDPSQVTDAMIRVQVLLDRARFSPGVIDGRYGENVRQAIAAFEKANGLPVDGRLDQAVWDRLSQADAGPALVEYVITEKDVAGPWTPEIPDDFEAMAKLDRLGYRGPSEALAERFHMDEDLLESLNPGVDFTKAGTRIMVAAPGSDRLQGQVARIVVDKSEKAVKAFDASGALLAFYPATIGSEELPSPQGALKVRAVAPAPTYTYDPEKLSFGGAERKLTIAAGPNNPVGSTWIDLDKEGYGIHGAPEPAQIGKTASHGCVRLTNWDAAELGRAVKPGVPVEFVG